MILEPTKPLLKRYSKLSVMREFLITLRFFVFIIVLSSCQFTERIQIQEDGSGRMSFSFDGSELMQMAPDSLSVDGGTKIDSLIVFKDFLELKKDSIATLSKEKQEQLKRLENFEMHMVINDEDKALKLNMKTTFQKVSELGNMLEQFKTAAMLSGKDGKKMSNGMQGIAMDTDIENEFSKVKYNFENNNFTRETTILDQEKFKQAMDSIAPMQMFLGGSKYMLHYTFPKKIKNSSAKGATFSLDGKSVTLAVNFMEYLKNPKLLDIEVELEE